MSAPAAPLLPGSIAQLRPEHRTVFSPAKLSLISNIYWKCVDEMYLFSYNYQLPLAINDFGN